MLSNLVENLEMTALLPRTNHKNEHVKEKGEILLEPKRMKEGHQSILSLASCILFVPFGLHKSAEAWRKYNAFLESFLTLRHCGMHCMFHQRILSQQLCQLFLESLVTTEQTKKLNTKLSIANIVII